MAQVTRHNYGEARFYLRVPRVSLPTFTCKRTTFMLSTAYFLQLWGCLLDLGFLEKV